MMFVLAFNGMFSPSGRNVPASRQGVPTPGRIVE
jgi:hypothetical protein